MLEFLKQHIDKLKTMRESVTKDCEKGYQRCSQCLNLNCDDNIMLHMFKQQLECGFASLEEEYYTYSRIREDKNEALQIAQAKAFEPVCPKCHKKGETIEQERLGGLIRKAKEERDVLL